MTDDFVRGVVSVCSWLVITAHPKSSKSPFPPPLFPSHWLPHTTTTMTENYPSMTRTVSTISKKSTLFEGHAHTGAHHSNSQCCSEPLFQLSQFLLHVHPRYPTIPAGIPFGQDRASFVNLAWWAFISYMPAVAILTTSLSMYLTTSRTFWQRLCQLCQSDTPWVTEQQWQIARWQWWPAPAWPHHPTR